jgi:hypothetical protein
MLHRNYWVIKEKGPPEFLDFLLLHNEQLYHELFVECRKAALKEACRVRSIDISRLVDIFERYKHRRQSQLSTREGILNPRDVGNLLVDMFNDEKGHPPGVYVVTAPTGKMQVIHLSFSKFSFKI